MNDYERESPLIQAHKILTKLPFGISESLWCLVNPVSTRQTSLNLTLNLPEVLVQS